MIQGRKFATSRTKKYGMPGYEFEAFGFVFVIERHERLQLAVIAERHFEAEGFYGSEEFKNEWKSIHPRRGFDPEQHVWVHWFHRKDPRHQPHFVPVEKQMDLDREWVTANDLDVGQSCNCERKSIDASH